MLILLDLLLCIVNKYIVFIVCINMSLLQKASISVTANMTSLITFV